MAGELDLATGLSLADAPVLKRNEAGGNYELTQYQNMTTATAAGWVFNYTHTDPGLNAIFNDVRFRQALSVAVDRQDISDTLFLRAGQAGADSRARGVDRVRVVDEGRLRPVRPGSGQPAPGRDGAGVGQ